ncbi:MAG TPA: nitroreductase family protein, partial [Ideonella sp.]|nr:nitroreductase family protein [Ideonella sp.]
RRASAGLLAAAALAARPGASSGAALRDVALPPPRTDGGLPLMKALALRRSGRDYDRRALPLPTLSDLLWAAFGVNRPDGGRTAPSWHGLMVTDLYLANAEGAWRYEAKGHRLLAQRSGDLRARTGTQDFVGAAALNLIYVAHGERMTEVGAAERRAMAAADAGCIAQNVYLYCASAGLAAVLRAAVDGPAVARLLGLPDGQFVTFAQSVGYPRR